MAFLSPLIALTVNVVWSMFDVFAEPECRRATHVCFCHSRLQLLRVSKPGCSDHLPKPTHHKNGSAWARIPRSHCRTMRFVCGERESHSIWPSKEQMGVKGKRTWIDAGRNEVLREELGGIDGNSRALLIAQGNRCRKNEGGGVDCRSIIHNRCVPEGGLEPPRPCGH